MPITAVRSESFFNYLVFQAHLPTPDVHRVRSTIIPDFLLQFFNLCLELLVFFYLPVQETDGNARLILNALGCQHVQVGSFVVAVFEIPGFDQAPADQCFEAVVDLAQAHTQLFGPVRAGLRLDARPGSGGVCSGFPGPWVLVGFARERAYRHATRPAMPGMAPHGGGVRACLYDWVVFWQKAFGASAAVRKRSLTWLLVAGHPLLWWKWCPVIWSSGARGFGLCAP